MKILFLDVDGVLNGRFSHDPLDSDKLDRLARVQAATGCKIVVSSTWRHYRGKMIMLEGALRSLGMMSFGVTPDLCQRVNGVFVRTPRGHEIQAWLRDRRDVTHIAILDDEGDMAHLTPWLIRTDIFEGLTDESADQCIALFDTPFTEASR